MKKTYAWVKNSRTRILRKGAVYIIYKNSKKYKISKIQETPKMSSINGRLMKNLLTGLLKIKKTQVIYGQKIFHRSFMKKMSNVFYRQSHFHRPFTDRKPFTRLPRIEGLTLVSNRQKSFQSGSMDKRHSEVFNRQRGPLACFLQQKTKPKHMMDIILSLNLLRVKYRIPYLYFLYRSSKSL